MGTGQSDMIWRRGPEICIAEVYEGVKDWYNLAYRDPSVATAIRRETFSEELTWGRQMANIFEWDYLYNAQYPNLDDAPPDNPRLNLNFLQKLKFHGDFVFAIPAAKEYIRARHQGALVEKFHVNRWFHGAMPRYSSDDLQALAERGYAFHGDDVFYLFGWDFYPDVNETHDYPVSAFGKTPEDMLTSLELQHYIFRELDAVVDDDVGYEIRATVYSEGDRIEIEEHLYRREIELWDSLVNDYTSSIKRTAEIENYAVAEGFYPECIPNENKEEMMGEE